MLILQVVVEQVRFRQQVVASDPAHISLPTTSEAPAISCAMQELIDVSLLVQEVQDALLVNCRSMARVAGWAPDTVRPAMLILVYRILVQAASYIVSRCAFAPILTALQPHWLR